MPYRIETTRRAEQDLAKIAKKNREAATEIRETIRALADDPRPPRSKKLTGQNPALYRVRSGDYRIIYRVDDGEIVVVLVKIGDRKDVYRFLKR